MINKEELEIELSKARLKRERNYELKDRFIKEIDSLRDDYEQRIRRIEQQMSSVSMSESDRFEYDNKRLDTLNHCLEFDETIDNFKKQMYKRCEDAEYEVFSLENMVIEATADKHEPDTMDIELQCDDSCYSARSGVFSAQVQNASQASSLAFVDRIT